MWMFDGYRKKFGPRLPRYSDKIWFRFDWFSAEYSCRRFALLFKVFISPSLVNFIYAKEDWQGDGEWRFIVTIFRVAFKFQIGLPDEYRDEPLKDWVYFRIGWPKDKRRG